MIAQNAEDELADITQPIRDLTDAEKKLAQWMLEHGEPEASQFQLELVRVAPWRCLCGCASIDSVVADEPEAPGKMWPLADFVFGSVEELSGIFVFEKGGLLAGLEVYSLAGDAPKEPPSSESLRPFNAA